jgi:hypothetical protein
MGAEMCFINTPDPAEPVVIDSDNAGSDEADDRPLRIELGDTGRQMKPPAF